MADKRKKLMDHAIYLFIRHGVISVTMDELARAAGVSKKTVYQFFGNKAVLVEAVVDLMIERSKLIISSNNDASIDPVHELVLQQDLFLQWIELRNLLNAMMLKRFPRALRAFNDFKAGYFKAIIHNNLSSGMAKGYYRPDLNLPGMADLYVSVADHFVFTSYRNYGDVFEALLLFINGVTTANGRSLVEKYKIPFGRF